MIRIMSWALQEAGRSDAFVRPTLSYCSFVTVLIESGLSNTSVSAVSLLVKTVLDQGDDECSNLCPTKTAAGQILGVVAHLGGLKS